MDTISFTRYMALWQWTVEACKKIVYFYSFLYGILHWLIVAKCHFADTSQIPKISAACSRSQRQTFQLF